MLGPMPGSVTPEGRAALGRALGARVEDVVVLQDPTRGGALHRDNAAPFAEAARVATRALAHWLATGEFILQDETTFIGLLSGTAAASDLVPLSELTKAHLRWRDAVSTILKEEASLLDVPGGVLVEALDAAAFGCDAFLVRMTKQFDAYRRHLEVALEDNRARLAHQSMHDPLTGLANRALFLDRLTHALRRSSRRRSRPAVLFLDIDRFKTINDGFGHRFGDELLVAVATMLQALVRPGDTVARFGGDEFVILCEDLIEGEAGAVAVAERVAAALSEPFQTADADALVTASIGIAVAELGADAEDVVANADVAMYAAKENGRARFEVFGEAVREALSVRVATETALCRVIERDELRVHYQPVFSADGRRALSMEALIRWQHPERGLLAPGEFIATAEESGHIVAIGTWVLTEACRQALLWHQADGEGLSVSVNVSARQLADPHLVKTVSQVLAYSGLPSSMLVLEITESVLLADTEETIATLQALKDLGVTLAIDDFGTGYSSLSYLRRLPVDIVKVDRSFVDGLGSGREDRAIVAAMIQLAHQLGLKVVAEGVETEVQLGELRELGCDAVQGFYFAASRAPRGRPGGGQASRGDERGPRLRRASWPPGSRPRGRGAPQAPVEPGGRRAQG